MLNNNFYSIQAKKVENDQFIYSISIDSKHTIFDGHFPNNPVTPGVVQMEIVKELTGDAIGNTVGLSTMSNCKFLAILNPEENPNVEIQLKITQEDAEIKVNAVIQNENGAFLKMSAVYSKI